VKHLARKMNLLTFIKHLRELLEISIVVCLTEINARNQKTESRIRNEPQQRLGHSRESPTEEERQRFCVSPRIGAIRVVTPPPGQLLNEESASGGESVVNLTLS